MSDGNPWHLDKRVPVVLILTIALQTGGAIWWAATIAGEVRQHKVNIDRHSTQIEALVAVQNAQAVTSARTEQELVGIRRSLDRLDRGQETTLQLLRQLLPMTGN